MSAPTVDGLMRQPSAIQADLDVARAARTRILTKGQAKGADGASKTEVTFADVTALIKDLESELALAQGRGGVSFTPTIGVGF
jgi:hypothetical protein